jgi:hypothetical protein
MLYFLPFSETELKQLVGIQLQRWAGKARCAFSDRNLHSRMPSDPTHVHLKLCHACDQLQSSWTFALLQVDTVNCVETLKAQSRHSIELTWSDDVLVRCFGGFRTDVWCSRSDQGVILGLMHVAGAEYPTFVESNNLPRRVAH